MNTLLIQCIVKKRSVNMNGDKAGDAIVTRYGNAEVGGPNESIWSRPRGRCMCTVLVETRGGTSGGVIRGEGARGDDTGSVEAVFVMAFD
jgi:hypothetical protein